MTLSRDFSQSVRQRATRDPQFHEALLAEVRNCFEQGEAEVGSRMLKKYQSASQASSTMDVEVGSGNVFADLGFHDAAELDIKVRLAVEIVRLINARRLSQVAAAALLKINQPKVSALKNYKLDGFSVERLMSFLLALGQDVEIRIRSHRSPNVSGRISIDSTRAQ